METITTNKGNWTGQTVKVRVNREKGTFNLFGYKFRIEIKADAIAHLYGSNWDGGEKPFVTGFQYKGEWTFSSCGCSREDKDVFVAAIQLLHNII